METLGKIIRVKLFMKLREVGSITYGREGCPCPYITVYNKENKEHRSDGPSSVWEDGFKEWWNMGVCLRSNIKDAHET